MLNSRLIYMLLCVTFCPMLLSAEPQQSKSAANAPAEQQGTPAIIEHIRQAGHHDIEASEEIINLLFPTEKNEVKQDARSRRTVYVVQVYSSSAGAKAKAEAQRIMAQVRAKLPGYECRLKWSNPNWRVFVGAYATQEEAQSALSKIKRACPSVAREAHIARDTR